MVSSKIVIYFIKKCICNIDHNIPIGSIYDLNDHFSYPTIGCVLYTRKKQSTNWLDSDANISCTSNDKCI